MEGMSGQKQCGILNKIEMLVGDIQRLVKGHGQQKNSHELELEDQVGDNNKRSDELEGQVGENSKSDECGHCSSLSTISQHIDIIHQLINEEKTNLKLRPSSVDQQNLVSSAEEVSVFDTSSIEKALNNSVVLRTIMQYLATKDLLNVRLVTKKWEEEATIQLLSTRQDIQVKFKWDDEELKFRNKFGSLEEFTDSCYGNLRRKFPCSQFEFEDVTHIKINEAPTDLFKFFSNHGHHIKSLSLQTFRNSTAALRILRKIVFEWTPCLKNLTLHGKFDNDDDVDDENEEPSQGDEDESKSSSDNGQQPSNLLLEHLTMSSVFGVRYNSAAGQPWTIFIRDILSSTPKIKTISDEDLWFTKEISAAGKIREVPDLVWKVCYEKNITPRCIEFSQFHPQLTFLEVDFTDFHPANFLPILLLILQSSQNTLKTLKFNGRIDLFDGASHMKLPIMKNLQKFAVTEWDSSEGGQGKLLPGRFSLQKLFPRLKSLQIEDVGTQMYDEVDNPFGYSGNASTTVQELTVGTGTDIFKPEWLSQAQHIYPNVRVLHLKLCLCEGSMPEFCSAIWTTWNESSLEELTINLPKYDSDDCANIVDQALTGFDLETCTMLQNQRCCSHCGENLERGPSILDMTKLKLFQLTCGLSNPTFPMFSRVSVVYAFEPMRRKHNLRVKINGFEFKETIQHGSLTLSYCLL